METLGSLRSRNFGMAYFAVKGLFWNSLFFLVEVSTFILLPPFSSYHWWRTLNESRRKLQTFNIGADSMSSVLMLKDATGNEFKTSNSPVIASVIDEMKRTHDTKVSP